MSDKITKPLSPTSLTVVDAARVLSKAIGQSITNEMLQADLDAGAPVNGDGTINLVNYAAWLIREQP